MKIFSIIPADRGGLYPVFPPLWDEYECSYFLFVSTPLVLSYYGDLFLRRSSVDKRLIFSLAVSELAILAGVQFLLYAAKGAAPDCVVGLSRLDHVSGGMLFRLPTAVVNMLSYLGYYKAAKMMRMIRFLLSWRFIV